MIWFDDQLVKVGELTLPGILKSIEIKESAKIDEAEVEGSATKPKQATGYEDAKITIELLLDDTDTVDKYQQLALIRAAFRALGQSVPQPLSIVSKDTAVHGVDKVLFKGLSHKAENKSGLLPVSLEFWEYVPTVIAAKKSNSEATTTKGSGSIETTTESGLSDTYSKYLTNRGSSPAIDDASSAPALNRVTQMPYQGG